jgi:hypothetical protein
MIDNQLYETVQEYSLYRSDLGYKIRAKIIKSVTPTGNLDFEWSISHYYKGSDSAIGAYIPSIQSANTFEETKNLLFSYINAFTSEGVIPNINY